MTSSPLLFFPYIFVSILLLLLLVSDRPAIQKNRKALAVAAIALPVLYFFYIIISFSTGVAYEDDYGALDNFHRMMFATEPVDRVKGLFAQTNEHRLAFGRILMLVVHLLHGNPSPKFQIIAGNLFLIGILWLFYRFFRQTGYPVAYFVPVALVLFSLVHYENAYWAITAIQNYPVIFFAMLGAYGLSKQSNAGNAAGVAAALLASFSCGNGIAVWIVGIITLIIQGRYRFLIVWLLFAASTLAFYLGFDYIMYPRDRSALLHHPFENLWVFLCFLGGLFYGDFDHAQAQKFYPDVVVSILAGVFVLTISLWWFLSFFLNRTGKRQEPYSFLSGILAFLLATAAMLVVSRPVGSNIISGGQFISQRYLIFSSVLWVAVYLALLFLNRSSARASKRLFGIFLFLNLGINIASYYRHIPTLATHQATLTLDKLYTDSFDGMLLSFGEIYGEKIAWNHPTAFKNLLKKLEVSDLYNPLQNFDTKVLEQIRQRYTSHPPDSSDWKVSVESENAFGFNGRVSPKIKITASSRNHHRGCPGYFILQSPTQQFVLPAVPERADPPDAVMHLNYWSDRYSFVFREFKFPEGEYDIWIALKEGGTALKPYHTGARVHLPGSPATTMR